MGELDAARRDFDRAIQMAREYDDLETESAAYANLALLEAEAGHVEAARDNAALGLAIAESAANAIHIIACSIPAAVAEVRAGRLADALARAESNLATIRELQIGLYYEPLLLATIARCKLALGNPGEALAAAEEGVVIMHTRGLRTCALLAPITLARVLLATQGTAAGERIDGVLARALGVARESHARVFEPPIHRELAALARLRGDDITAAREQAAAERILATKRSETTDGDAIGQ
jgi:adenylate cyclase